jgi:hypothetical protein
VGASVIRNELDGLRARSLEAYVEAALRLGGTELVAAERAGRELVRRCGRTTIWSAASATSWASGRVRPAARCTASCSHTTDARSDRPKGPSRTTGPWPLEPYATATGLSDVSN